MAVRGIDILFNAQSGLYTAYDDHGSEITSGLDKVDVTDRAKREIFSQDIAAIMQAPVIGQVLSIAISFQVKDIVVAPVPAAAKNGP